MFSNSSGLKRVFEKLCFDNGFFARGRPNLINIAAVLNLSGDVWTEGGGLLKTTTLTSVYFEYLLQGTNLL